MALKKQAFTLIELMIVVAIIAILAAIAIPSLLRSRMAANQTSAMSVLKNMVSVQASFRQTEADGNGIRDYWTGDIAGLYALEDAEGARLMYVEIPIAKADDLALNIYAGGLDVWTAPVNGPTGRAEPKAGYLFHVLALDEDGRPYARDTSPDGVVNPYNGTAKFAFEAYPADYGRTGVRVFIMNEEGVIYGVDGGANAAGGGNFITDWPPGSPDPTLVPHPISGMPWAAEGG